MHALCMYIYVHVSVLIQVTMLAPDCLPHYACIVHVIMYCVQVTMLGDSPATHALCIMYCVQVTMLGDSPAMHALCM